MGQRRALVMTAVKKPVKKTNALVLRAIELYCPIIRYRSHSSDSKTILKTYLLILCPEQANCVVENTECDFLSEFMYVENALTFVNARILESVT